MLTTTRHGKRNETERKRRYVRIGDSKCVIFLFVTLRYSSCVLSCVLTFLHLHVLKLAYIKCQMSACNIEHARLSCWNWELENVVVLLLEACQLPIAARWRNEWTLKIGMYNSKMFSPPEITLRLNQPRCCAQGSTENCEHFKTSIVLRKLHIVCTLRTTVSF